MKENIKEKIKKHLKNTLTAERYNHSLRVSKRAIKLAKIFKEDEEKAQLAGLLHDIGKIKDNKTLLNLCNHSGIILEEKIKSDEINFHCVLGMIITEKIFNIRDEDILNSIRYHTTGREKMSRLEKIIYLADYTEEGRDFDGVERARELSETNLEEAMIFAIENTIKYLIKSRKIIHLDSLKARNFLIK